MSPHDSQLDQLRQRLKDIVAQQNQAAANNSVRSSTSRAQAAAYGATGVKSGTTTNNNNNTGSSKHALGERSAARVADTKDGAHATQGNGAARRNTSRASGMGQSSAGGGRGMGYGRGGQRGLGSGIGAGLSQNHGRGGQGQRSATATGGDDLGLKLFETIVGLAQDGMERAARSFASSLFSTGEQGGATQQQQHAAAHLHSHHDHHGDHNGGHNGLFGAQPDSHVDGMTGASARARGTPQRRNAPGTGHAPSSHGSLASSLEEWADNFGPDSATIEDPIMAIGKQEMGQLRHDLVQGLYEGLVPAELRSRIAQDWHIGTDPFARREQGASQGAGRGAGAGYGRGQGRGQGQGNGSHHGARSVRTVEPFNLNPAALKQGEEAGFAAMRALQQAQMPTPQPVPPLQQTECEADTASRPDATATTEAEQASTLEGSSAVASTSAPATEPQMSATTAALAVAEATAKAVTAQATAATAAAGATAPAESVNTNAEAAQAQQEALEVAAAISRDFTQTSDVHMSLEERASLIKDLRTTEIMADLAAEQAMAQESAAQQAQAIASDIQQVKSQADIQLDPEQHEALRAMAAFDGLGAEVSGLGAEGSALRSSLEASKFNAALNSTTTTTESSTTAAPATAIPAADTANSAEQTAETDNSELEVFARTGIDHGHTHPWEQGPLHWWHEHADSIRHQHEQVFAEIVPQLIEQLESELKLLPLEHLSAADVHAYLESLPADEDIESLGHNVFGQQMLKALTQSMREHLQALLPEAERAAVKTASAETATAPAAATDSGTAANAADTTQQKATTTTTTTTAATSTATAARANAAPTVETTASEPDAAQIAMREDMVQGDFGPQRVTLLGATGSIGDSTCEVMRQHPELYVMHALAANSNVEKMLRLIAEFKPARVALRNEQAAATLKERLADDPALRALRVEVLAGDAGVVEVAGDGAAEIVVDAIVGAAGLAPVLAALKTGCRVCLANKESLVMTGQLFFDVARQFNSTVVPVDSEHSAIFQCLPPQEQRRLGACDLKAVGVHEILLTGSGGPFRDCALSELQNVTPQMAINHPVWSMGPKISVDSATMMNKALEFIEARYLFNAAPEQVRVVIHPQSVIHSMVSYVDGAVLAQLGMPDMKTPIAHALAYPHRISAPVAPLDFTKISALTFKEPDKERYPCLFMGIEASKQGQASTTALNAANEVAVAAFLHGELSFLGIAEVVEEVLSKLSATTAYSLEEIMAVDAEARSIAKAVIQQRAQ